MDGALVFGPNHSTVTRRYVRDPVFREKSGEILISEHRNDGSCCGLGRCETRSDHMAGLTHKTKLLAATLALTASIAFVATAIGPVPSAAGQSPEVAEETGPATIPEKGRCPVEWSALRFSHDWGDPRSVGGGHKGTDLFAEEGTTAYAVENGIVTQVRNTPSGAGGISVWLLGDSGVQYYYSHNSANAVTEPGTRVAAGDVVAYVGASGNAAGGSTHVHFGIDPEASYGPQGGGAWADPFSHVRRWCFGAEPDSANWLAIRRFETRNGETAITTLDLVTGHWYITREDAPDEVFGAGAGYEFPPSTEPGQPDPQA